ncbi:lipase maturation factor family protein [Halococcus sp. AFM35]|uniref:lipase maturation factor family protein n=1 Tax=Halococcus sp. AFM35 TaxID=3421653 RepID=UPI003EBE94CE
MVDIAGYWLVRFLFRRALAVVYLTAFLVAADQYRGLHGESGIFPIDEFTDRIDVRNAPSLFYFVASDSAIAACAWAGVGLSVLAVTGLSDAFGTLPSILVWGGLWALYLSFVNVGRTFYGFGWETLLLETGFLAIFLGGMGTTPPDIVIWLLRWVLFRVMFGAGLIKLRGDECWRDFTCLFYHYETQPMPNPLSWYFDKLPAWVHKASIGVHHVIELAVPFFYFAPQPIAAIAGLLTIVYQGWLMVSGNFAWLNALTIVLAISTFSDTLLSALSDIAPPTTMAIGMPLQVAVYGLLAVVVILSYWPVRNLVSSGQAMNRSFDPLHLVNTYGAFGSITKERYELVIEGTHDEEPTDETEWRTYEFKGKPTDTGRKPPQWAPYHLRLDWQLWFAAMTPQPRREWFPRFVERLLAGNEDVRRLLAEDPFPDEPPTYIRVRRYRYEYTTVEERRETGEWWRRKFVNDYYGPVSRRSLRRSRRL